MGTPVWAAFAGAQRGGLRLYGAEGRAPGAGDAGAAGGWCFGPAGGRKQCSPRPPETCQRRGSQLPETRERIDDARSRLAQTLARFDDAAAHAVLDRLLADWGVATVISEVIVPYLVDLGERWAAGTATIAEASRPA